MNENELQVIDERELFGKEFRIYGTAENPLFLAKQVAEMIEHSNPSKMLNCVDEEEKTTLTISYSGNMTTNQLFLTEDGLYEVLMQSHKPIAKQFKKEVKNILKTIRKHGAYMTENTIEKALTSPDFLIQLATQLKEEREQKKKLEVMNAAKDQVICELKPKADYTDEILKCPGTVTITQIAKDYGMSGTKMNKILNELGVQFKKSGQWFIYEKYNGKGYTKSQTVQIERHGVKDCVMNTKWTQKGRLFLYELLKNEGIYPSIEKVDMLG